MKNKHLIFSIFIIFSFFLASCPENPTTPNSQIILITEIKTNPLAIGKEFEILGKNFDTLRGNSEVIINHRAIDSVDYVGWSDSVITIKLPIWASNGELYVRSDLSESNRISIEIEEFPIILRIEPNMCFEGDTVKIFGRFFGEYIEDSSFVNSFADLSKPFSWSDTLVYYVCPITNNPYDITRYVTVIRGNKRSEYQNLFALKYPHINEVTPTYTSTNTNVVLSGRSFKLTNISLLGENPEAYINEVKITDISKYEYDRIVFKLPSNAVSGDLVVKRFARPSNKIFLNVLEQPAISSISPDIGEFGTQIRINGENFTDIIGSVYFEDIPADIISWSNNEIVAKVPNIKQCLQVFVQINGVKSNFYYFKHPNCKDIDSYNFSTVNTKSPAEEFLDSLKYQNGYYTFKTKRIITETDRGDAKVKFSEKGLYIDEIVYTYSFTETFGDARVFSFKQTVYTVTARNIPSKSFDENSVQYTIGKYYSDRLSISFQQSGGWKNNKTGDSGVFNEKGTISSDNVLEFNFTFSK